MSNVVLPTFVGMKWGGNKSPYFSTIAKTSVSGNEVRAALMAYPKWNFTMSYEVIRDDVANNELKQLMGFFLARQGSFDSFLYTDPSDSTVTSQQFGTGDASAKKFQLIRSYGAFSEPVMNINGSPVIKANGVTKTAGTDYTIDSLGMVTFVTAPAAGATLTWAGSFYYRCRFLHDDAEFSQFMKNLWELKKFDFVGCLGNKI